MATTTMAPIAMAAIAAPGKLFFLLLAAVSACGQQQENSFLEEINFVGTSPKTYAQLLRSRLRLFDGKVLRLPGATPLLTQEGAPAVAEAIQYLEAARPTLALKWSRPLALAALDHARDLGNTGAMSHCGSKGEDPEDRAQRWGSKASLFGENISFGPSGAREVVLDLLVDDGAKSRSHRTNLMAASFDEVGAACGPHKRYGTVCLIDLAGN